MTRAAHPSIRPSHLLAYPQLPLLKKGLYTFSTAYNNVRKGCTGRSCYAQPPEPTLFPYEIEDFSEGPVFGPGEWAA